jgi:hypothetical protein
LQLPHRAFAASTTMPVIRAADAATWTARCFVSCECAQLVRPMASAVLMQTDAMKRFMTPACWFGA